MSHATTAEISDQDLEAVAGGGGEVQKVAETKGRSSKARRGLAHADTTTDTEGAPVDYELADDFAP